MNAYIYIIIGMSTSFMLCISMLLFYLKYRKNIIQQQYQMKVAEVDHQKELIHSIITSQEEERKRIGMDLHDEIGASLSAVKLMLQMDKNVNTELDTVIGSVRNISHNLFPAIKGEFGFSDALHNYCEKLNFSPGLQIDINFQNEKAEKLLKEEIALAFYRIIIELITNTCKHANATEIDIHFYFAGQDNYAIDYKDNGVGGLQEIKSKNKGIGFNNIESRLGMMNASMEIKDVEKGVFIQFQLPILKEKK